MKKLTFQRDQLYKEVWSTPITQLAKKYEISDFQLKRACKELEVPVPTRGHWAKVRNGKKVKVIALPVSKKDSFTLNIDDGFKSTVKLKKELRQTIFVSKRLNNPHPLVEATPKSLKGLEANRYGRVKGSPLDVSVSPENVSRAMRIMDTVLKTLQKRGKGVRCFEENHASKMYIDYDGEKIYIQLRENGMRRKRDMTKEKNRNRSYWGYDGYEYFPNGELKLIVGSHAWRLNDRVISDTKTKRLEDRLDEFFEWLSIVVEELRIERLETEEKRRQSEIERRIREEAERQRKAELERRKKLEEQSEVFTKSQYIYDFIKEIEKQGAQLDLDDDERQKFDRWIVWAREHADRLNPVKQVMNSILES